MADIHNMLALDHLQFFITYDKMDLRGRVFISNMHIHHTGELMLVRSGESIIRCEGKITHAVAPYIVYFPPREPHTQDNSASSLYERWCFPIFPSDIGQAVSMPPHHFVIQLTEEQCAMFTTYAEILTKHYSPPGNRWLMHCIPRSMQEEVRLKYLLLLFLNEMEPLIPVQEGGEKNRLINDVCMYINEHPAENLSLDILSERFFVAKSSLTHEFRRRMGMSVGDFITASRVMHVKNLLREEMPLSEIAEKCGFSSASYLIKVFTKHTGITPSRYRARLSALLTER